MSKKMKLPPLRTPVRPISLNVFVCMLVLVSYSCSKAQDNEELPVRQQTRIINFSGHEWVVRASDDGKEGPGPNYVSDSEENVWVDDDGRLHLKIVQKGGSWYCSGISLRRSLGYNKYVFYVGSEVGLLDPNVVGGLFTYMNDTEEIDIEFSRWADPASENSQFAVQPSHETGNKVRYDLGPNSGESTHMFDWQPEKIEFASYRGHTLDPLAEAVIGTWTYTGDDVPPDSNERLKINLWLFRGNPPTDQKEAEMIIDRVEIL